MNKLKMRAYLIILFLSLGGMAIAQEDLSLEDAIAKTLRHNFDIRVADLAAQQAARNNTLGNSGFSPYVLLNASASTSRNNVRSDLASGAVQNNPNAVSTGYNPYVSVNWTIFDGGKMFLMKKELSQLEAVSQVQLKAQMQTMVSRAIQVYAQVVLDDKQLAAASTALSLARTRMLISDIKFQTGAGAKIDYLQARVDYNARQSDSLNYLAALTQSRDSLCVLMGQDEDNGFIVEDSLELDTGLQPMDKDRLANVNLALSAYRYNAMVSHTNAQIANTYFLPSLSFSGGYNYAHTSNSTGFALFTQSYGPYGALTVSLPVFEGGNLRRQSKVASLQAMRDDMLYERQNTILARQYRTGWRNYQVAVMAYDLEHENIKYAKENLDVQQARFKVGIGTTLEARQAENDYVTALLRLYTAAYNLKVSETIMLELENQLVR